MVLDGLKAYAQLAGGLTELTRQRATATARALLDQGTAQVGAAVPGTLREQLSSLTEELLDTARSNRALLLGLVETEVERAAGRLGLVSGDAFARVQERADRLELRIRELELAETSGAAKGRPGADSARGARAAASAPAAAVTGGRKPRSATTSARAAKAAGTAVPATTATGPSAAGPSSAAPRSSTPRTRRPPATRPHGDALLDNGRDEAGGDARPGGPA